MLHGDNGEKCIFGAALYSSGWPKYSRKSCGSGLGGGIIDEKDLAFFAPSNPLSLLVSPSSQFKRVGPKRLTYSQ